MLHTCPFLHRVGVLSLHFLSLCFKAMVSSRLNTVSQYVTGTSVLDETPEYTKKTRYWLCRVLIFKYSLILNFMPSTKFQKSCDRGMFTRARPRSIFLGANADSNSWQKKAHYQLIVWLLWNIYIYPDKTFSLKLMAIFCISFLFVHKIHLLDKKQKRIKKIKWPTNIQWPEKDRFTIYSCTTSSLAIQWGAENEIEYNSASSTI